MKKSVSCSVVSNSVTPWMVAHQALSMGFSRQEHWSGLPCPPPWNHPNPGTESRSPALQADFLPFELAGKPYMIKEEKKLKKKKAFISLKASTTISLAYKVLSRSAVSDLCDSMDYSPPGSFVHGIFQARILQWVAMSFSRGSSRLRDWTWVSHIVGRFFIVWATRQAL